MLGCQIAKQKVRCTPEITQQAAFQKRNQNHAASRKSIQMHSTPKGYPKCSGPFKPPSVHWRESIPSKHWCHATHRLPGASPKKSTAARLQLVPTPTLQACSPFPKKNSHLCGSFARTDAANEFTQFDGHGGATGPAGDPAVPPRPGFSDSTRLSRGVVGGEVNHGFIQVTLFVGGTQPPQPIQKTKKPLIFPFCWGHSLA